jgi:hypothetical protein
MAVFEAVFLKVVMVEPFVNFLPGHVTASFRHGGREGGGGPRTVRGDGAHRGLLGAVIGKQSR